MKIVFFPASMLDVSAHSVDERPLGGMETALIRLSAALTELGHNVIVISEKANPPLSEPLYLPQSILPRLGEVDVIIAIREWTPLLISLKTKLRMFWTGDSYDLSQNTGIGDKRVFERIDNLLCVSNWHAETLCQASGFPPDKTYILRNGVNLNYFAGQEKRARKRLIYSSTPYRGLKHLLPIFAALKDKHPDLELHIFSAYQVYSRTGHNNDFNPELLREYQQMVTAFKALPKCFVHGNVTQERLAREMMRSSILAYPNTFEETSCITALEAQAAGCVVVSSYLAALPETVGDRGILLKEAPGSKEYINKFIEELDRLLSDDRAWQQLSAASQEASKNFDWSVIAKQFAEFLQARLTIM